uniref:Small ribosomal subunit protein uS9c n=1 Tax=Oogamochlamys gigantea TaxID=158507 RepID=A0A0S2LNK7_9CHLO|nr:ribosomal protein S9 [Oogamochlamys gigantea]ALO62822.1 ribosomal protein S9 [Oogamochlamys gigantea]
MEILARAVGRRKEAVAQVQILPGTGKFLINNKSAEEYLQSVSQKFIAVKSPFEILQANLSNHLGLESLTMDKIDTIVKVKGGGLSGQSDAIKLGIARALCHLVNSNSKLSINFTNPAIPESNENFNENIKILRKEFKTKGYLTQDSRVKERRKYGLKKARKASQYHKR